MVGAITRPEFSDLRLDWGAVKRAAELAQLFRRGDNGLLVGLAAIFEREGVRIVGAHEIAPRLVAPAGRLGGRGPTPEDEADIAFGARLLAALSRFRRRPVRGGGVGPGARDRGGRGHGRDARAGGRDAGERSASGTRGWRASSSRRRSAGQDLRLDMPAIGPGTIDGAARAELRGLALAAGACSSSSASAASARPTRRVCSSRGFPRERRRLRAARASRSSRASIPATSSASS